jgi:hypothetical protein
VAFRGLPAAAVDFLQKAVHIRHRRSLTGIRRLSLTSERTALKRFAVLLRAPKKAAEDPHCLHHHDDQ